MGSVLCSLFVEASQSHGGAGGWPPANLTQLLFSGGMPPDPLGSLRSMLWVVFCALYSLKPRRATGVQRLAPCEPDPAVVFWGHAPRPPELASLEPMGGGSFFLFVEASQSDRGEGGWPSASSNPELVFLGKSYWKRNNGTDNGWGRHLT
ncbi:hypothetical protein TRICI_000694 [Trichomonascus ciferrii]|uniref:Uncharacterized protein n=1 Tax=Trichomonascus ciferrii TaxID=44093 RepID=A0A642VC14_9ASCO|nr:hypothetical protein TRICI_000694 [Trichomonascus ciferrii]